MSERRLTTGIRTLTLVSMLALAGCLPSNDDKESGTNEGNVLAADVVGAPTMADSPQGGGNAAASSDETNANGQPSDDTMMSDPMNDSMAMMPVDPGMATGGQDSSMMPPPDMNQGMTPDDGSGMNPGAMEPPAEQADADGCFTREFNIVRDSFMETDSGSLNYVAFNKEVTAQNPVSDLIMIELHPERGFPMQPGRYDLAEIGQDISACQICVIGQQNINFQRRTRDHILMGKTGIVEIVSIGDVGEAFQARFIDVKMHKVEIRRAGFLNTLTSEYVEPDYVRCADGFEIDVIRKARPAMIGRAGTRIRTDEL